MINEGDTFDTTVIPDPLPKSRFECSDCGKNRPGYDRNLCRVCSAHVCEWCQLRHHLQHPPSVRKRHRA